MARYDAVVVGSGPNGLAAAITLAREGLSVLVLEAQDTIGGGARSAELTLPGFVHDMCSAIHPFAFASPVFRDFPLERYGLKWVHSPAPLAHPLDGGNAAILENSLEETAQRYPEDRDAYRALFEPAARAWIDFQREGFRSLPRQIGKVAVGFEALRPARRMIESRFRDPALRALMAGNAGHAMLPLEKSGSNLVVLGLVTMGHVGGWPFPEGGAQKLSDAMAAHFRSLGGVIETGVRITSLRQVPPARAVLLDVTARQVLDICGEQLPRMYKSVLRNFRYSMAAFKVDWALSEPVPWRSAEIRRAATVHIGGTLEEIAAAERVVWKGGISDAPLIIAAQHSLFDPTRAPAGKHTFWAYCHVPNGSDVDMVERIEKQIERFAPGFRDCILQRSVMPPRALEAHNPNLIGGDIVGGVQDLWQIGMRPSFRYWATPLKDVFICSSSTPPGAGVHGMCGWLAARLALKRRFQITPKKLFDNDR